MTGQNILFITMDQFRADLLQGEPGGLAGIVEGIVAKSKVDDDDD